jgi:hypothetical protein
MSNMLARVKQGDADAPNRTLLYGVEGIGKSTWGSQSARPIFICAEDGLGKTLDHVPRITVTSYAEILEIIHELRTMDHEYKSLNIDTFDMTEALIYEFVCKRDGKASIEDYGYGKGYTAAQTELRNLLALLDRLRTEKKMEIIFLAHAQIKSFQNPAGDNYDRYIMKGNEKMTGLLKEWCDVVLFARYEVHVKKDSPKLAKGKAIMSDARVVHTAWSPAWDAKNRLGLPETLPLNYDEFAAAARMNLNGGSVENRELAQYIADHFETALWADAATREKALAFIGGSLDVDALSALKITKLRPTADRLAALQPQQEVKTDAAS